MPHPSHRFRLRSTSYAGQVRGGDVVWVPLPRVTAVKLIRKLNAIEIHQVSGAQTTLVNREDGLHVYLTHKDEQFELGSLIFSPDGSRVFFVFIYTI